MDSLLVRDVRRFRGENHARLAPMTFLVGENSTGKSTLLALTRIAWDIAYSRTEPNFNEEPFQLGAYDDIAHYHGGQGKRARSFAIGFEFSARSARGSQEMPTAVVGTFTSSAGQPALTHLDVRQGEWRIVANTTDSELQIELSTPNRTYELRSESEYALPSLTGQNLSLEIDLLRIYSFRSQPEQVQGRFTKFKGSLPESAELDHILRVLRPFGHPSRFSRTPGREGRRPFATAPIRTKPRRTYDPLRDIQSPEGDHVPMLLARLSTTQEKLWGDTRKALAQYGQESGLFEDINIKRLGDNEASPFQVTVRPPGQRLSANLIDVGYGVSQILPILVDCLTAPAGGFFLMQQPEVHLHPRAQAELGNFLVKLHKSRGHRFVIETHSDYLVDRVRMEVKKGNLRPHDVSLLFLESAGSLKAIHEIGLTKQGTPIDQPETYRTFFLEEELRLLADANVPDR
jgi:hypothetical protein